MEFDTHCLWKVLRGLNINILIIEQAVWNMDPVQCLQALSLHSWKRFHYMRIYKNSFSFLNCIHPKCLSWWTRCLYELRTIRNILLEEYTAILQEQETLNNFTVERFQILELMPETNLMIFDNNSECDYAVLNTYLFCNMITKENT
ncbi:hypothetical protein DPMN_061363 [Dreissena polymorpha]|uniref:Uncharacterized protein n=1 Tax=Dreissena polymorpha TaxID=45954 RepID=A0A9D4C7Q4_DREPO|nr:hypothetical protein DPMN_061363 [Dreissena polymorpha]